jgi:hypothetical protein
MRSAGRGEHQGRVSATSYMRVTHSPTRGVRKHVQDVQEVQGEPEFFYSGAHDARSGAFAPDGQSRRTAAFEADENQAEHESVRLRLIARNTHVPAGLRHGSQRDVQQAAPFDGPEAA